MDAIEVSDRLAINELTAKWTDSVNWRNYDRFRSTWTEDAVWTISVPFAMHVEGVDPIVAKLRDLLTFETAFFQALHVGTVEISGDSATARWGMTEFGRPNTPGQGYFNHAVYSDKLKRTSAGWKFERRDYFYVYVDDSLLKGKWFNLPDKS